MNAPAAPVHFRPRRPSVEQLLRHALTDPKMRAPIKDATGWDDSQVSRVLSGQMGVTIDKIDVVVGVLGMRVVTRPYLEAMSELAGTGVNCWCAREGMGDCGMHERAI